MGSFLEIFGQITVYHVVVILIALGYAFEKLKYLYIWVTTRHDKQQDQLQEMKTVIKTVNQLTHDNELSKCAHLAVLNFHLFDECDRVLQQKEITLNDLEKIKRLYYAYHNLGGNGIGTKLYNDVLVLPIKREKKEA